MSSKAVKAIAVVLNVLFLLPQVVVQSLQASSFAVSDQLERIVQLEEDYSNGNYTPVIDADFCDFDLDAAVDNGVRLNRLQFIGTHNSYKQGLTPALQSLLDILLPSFGFLNSDIYSYSHETLTEQLNRGVRSFELDAMYDGQQLRCCHVGFFDMKSSCLDLGLAFKEISLWSQANPGHLPITLLLEGKPNVLVGKSVFRAFDKEGILCLDSLVRDSFGESLYAPADMLGDYSTFAALRADGATPTLEETLGKVIAILHPTSDSDKYVADDPTLRSQSMFPAVRDTQEDYAMVLMCNNPVDEIRGYIENGFFVRTRIDMDNISSVDRLSSGIAVGANILSTDFPPKAGNPEYIASISGHTVGLSAEAAYE